MTRFVKGEETGLAIHSSSLSGNKTLCGRSCLLMNRPIGLSAVAISYCASGLGFYTGSARRRNVWPNST